MKHNAGKIGLCFFTATIDRQFKKLNKKVSTEHPSTRPTRKMMLFSATTTRKIHEAKSYFPCDFVYRKIHIIFPTSGAFRNIAKWFLAKTFCPEHHRCSLHHSAPLLFLHHPLPVQICRSTVPKHCEAGEGYWLQGEAALQEHSLRDADPQPVIPKKRKWLEWARNSNKWKDMSGKYWT